MRSSRVVERKNDFEPAVVIPTSLVLRIYRGVGHARGSGTEEKGTRRDELDLDSHPLLSFHAFAILRRRASLPLFLVFFHTPPLPAPAHFSHSLLGKYGSSCVR